MGMWTNIFEVPSGMMMYFQYVSNTAHTCSMQRPKRKISNNGELL
jgi:hypothetical protein